jgi:hypothetical protein
MKYLLIFITLFGIVCVLFSEELPNKITSDFFTKKDKSLQKEITSPEFDEAYKTWHTKNILNYSMKIRYSAFSPMSGIWEIKVDNGRVVNWKYKKTENDEKYRDFAVKLTMDYLFEMAQAAIITRDNSKFRIYTRFDSTDGHVLYILKKAVSNGKFAQTDSNFRYDVLELNMSVTANN